MNKNDLIERIARGAGLSKAQAGRALEAVTTSVTKTLQQGDTVSLLGFGTFQVSQRAERKGRNPRTGAEIVIPASKRPTFKAGKGLKDAVK
ncbi:transcriptional regulator [Litchfieldella anticariensis FP35 = DSM 16096]|uniref:Transcriptional regulator n=1 Tax=Litchfieldella anticariensis (strain DSM 16096 / CECT 5854 / CIP 108499 / LMG 22089 / FP35) TaxID=1121939 RepID=S2KIZ3_LITA3|nr:HU family DNA-binding protein [Halomonas anticariensis]EPC02132.1 transcriptional regulator [Halomonas anticariensis FP35 = DSM 16096]